MKSDFLIAVTQLAAERNLPRDIVISAIEAALVSAYRKDSITDGHDISVKLDQSSGDVTVHLLKSVVEEVTDPQSQISLTDVRKIQPEAEIGDSVATDSIPHNAGRIAAQTAKQVVMQRLREAERELVYEEYREKDGEVFAVNIQRIEPRQIIVDLGRAEAILPTGEQVPYERYRTGMKMRVLLQSVQRSSKGPELIVSRADSLLVKRLFEMEVPEIYNGSVEIVAIAREPGSRSKVAVRAKQAGVDPVGSCVGLRGVRIQNIVNELLGEKIDVIEWSKDPARFVSNALSPSQVLRIDLDPDRASAVAVVPDRHLSLAIGREGQNARLAARLTGWNVDIQSNVEADAKRVAQRAGAAPSSEEAEPVTAEADIERLGLATRALNVLKLAGIEKVGDVLAMTQDEVRQIKSFGEKSYEDLAARLKALKLALAVAEPLAGQPEAKIETETETEPVPAAPVEEIAADQVEAKPPDAGAEEQAVEAPAVVIAPVEAVAPVQQEPATVEAVPVTPVVTVPEPVFVPQLEPEPVIEEPVPVLEHTTSLKDLPDTVWSIRKGGAVQSGQIRFAEDIVGLRGGVTARRKSQRGGARRGKSKAGKRRRFR